MRTLGFALRVAVVMASLASCGGGSTDVASYPGSGGTGIDPGSGGTGNVASVGSVDGFGSVIVNGVTYDNTSTTNSLDSISTLALGMVVRISGSLNSQTTGVAQTLSAGVELMDTVASTNPGAGTLVVAGVTVQTGTATVYDGVAGLSALSAADPVFVYGVPEGSRLLATRIEKRASLPRFQTTGAIQSVDTLAQTFQLGTLTISYGGTSYAGGLTAAGLATGVIVQVRAPSAPVAGLLNAQQLQLWQPANPQAGGNVHLRGAVSDFSTLASFRVLGIPVKADGNGVQFVGSSASIGNGSEVQVKGHWLNNVLVAQKVTVYTGTGGAPVTYSLSGPMSLLDTGQQSFSVKGQKAVYTVPGTTFANGTVADLQNGKKVQVLGTQVTNGVLSATSVTFLP